MCFAYIETSFTDMDAEDTVERSERLGTRGRINSAMFPSEMGTAKLNLGGRCTPMPSMLPFLDVAGDDRAALSRGE